MGDLIPLFKSHYSIGRSILTLNAQSDKGSSSPTSVFDILIKNKIEELFLVEDSMSGFLEAYTNASENKIKLNFGLRLNFLCDIKEKSEESLRGRCKYIIFAKNTKGYKRLIKIWSFASKDGFYYTPNLDFESLKMFWDNDDLLLCVPFYDSYLHRNSLESAGCIPDFSYTDPVFFLEDNGIPFDYLIEDKVKNAADDLGHKTQKVKSIYYENKKDFLAYLTFKCINNRSTLEKPNFDHLCSNRFCFEDWKEKSVI